MTAIRRTALFFVSASCAVLALAAAPPTADVTGRVLDTEGRPLAGVEIWAPDVHADFLHGREKHPVAITRADGTFEARGVEPGVLVLAACPAGYLPASFQFFSRPARGEIRLRRAARIAGTVVDESGAPVAGAQLTARSASDREDSEATEVVPPCPPEHFPRSSTSGVRGRFVLTILEPGWHEIYASAPGFLPLSSPVRRKAGTGEGELRVVLSRGEILEGRVTDADGAPVVNAELTLESSLSVRTDGAGRYRLSGFEPGPLHLMVVHRERGWVDRKIDRGGHLDIRMPRHTPIRIQVVGPSGTPFQDAWLTVDEQKLHLDPAKSGRFRFAVPPGSHEITAHAWNQPPARLAVTAAGHPLDLEIRFPASGTISGRVTGLASGEDAAVWARNERGDGLPGVEAGEDGRFEISSAGPGAWTVTADTGRRSLERRVRLEAGGRATVDFRFPPLPEVRGRVLDVHGKPAANAEVAFSRGPNQAALVQAKTGQDGRFAVHLVDGSYRMWASWPPFGPSPDLPLTVAGAPVDGLELRLSAAAVLTGHIHGLRTGEVALPWAERPSEVGRVWGRWDRKSGYTIFSLGPGDWIVSAQVNDRTVSVPVRIPPGTYRVSVDLKVPRGSASLEGSVAGWPEKQDLWVTARRLDPPRLELFAELAGTDSFFFDELPPGRYRLRAGTGHKVVAERIVEVPGKPVVLRPRNLNPAF